MANVSKAVDSARKAFSKRGGMLRTVDALRLGIHPRTLYKLRDQGSLNVLAGDSTASPLHHI